MADSLTPDVAKRLTELRLNPTTQARIDELAGRANEGVLTSAERAEYADIVEGLDFLGILKAKAGTTFLKTAPLAGSDASRTTWVSGSSSAAASRRPRGARWAKGASRRSWLQE